MWEVGVTFNCSHIILKFPDVHLMMLAARAVTVSLGGWQRPLLIRASRNAKLQREA
jgi:hypothetical protein